MSDHPVQEAMARAEDRALLGSNLSADPGAGTEGRAAHPARHTVAGRSVARLSPIRDWHESAKSLAARPRVEAVKTSGDGLPDISNPRRSELHFTLNHYRPRFRSRSNPWGILSPE